MVLSKEYVNQGYSLIQEYLTENKLRTKERNFIKRFDTWYNRYKDEDFVDGKAEERYVKLEHYFYTNILKPRTQHEKALTKTLDIINNSY